ncbi:hypothetical protein HK101_003109 [Irineochytrium annulatum]|nr:hypothetical protein HK101_003109 [Irineochytrium annulatum]
MAVSSPSASAAWIRSQFDPVPLKSVYIHGAIEWSSLSNFVDSIGELVHNNETGQLAFRQRDWKYVMDDRLEKFTYLCPTHRMVYLVRCIFPEVEIESAGPRGYKTVATVYMRHKASGLGVAFTEWKGAFLIRLQLSFYKSGGMHPACVGNTFLPDVATMLKLLGPGDLLKDYPHPSALTVEAPQDATPFLTRILVMCSARDADYNRAERVTAPWSVLDRDVSGDVDILAARRDRTLDITFDPVSRTSDVSKRGETSDTAKVRIARVIPSDLLLYRLLCILVIRDTRALNVQVPHVSGIGELQTRERTVGVWSVVLEGPDGCRLLVFDLCGLSEVVVVGRTGEMVDKAVCDLLDLLCSEVSPHPYDGLVAGLPTYTEIEGLLNKLNVVDRSSFAFKLGIKHTNSPGIKSLVRSFLQTTSLGPTIPILTASGGEQPAGPGPSDKAVAPGSAAEAVGSQAEADEWAVVPEVEEVKLLVEQTNACKMMGLRSVGVQLATAIKDPELLGSIILHPSNTMRKSRRVLQTFVTSADDSLLQTVYNQCHGTVKKSLETIVYEAKRYEAIGATKPAPRIGRDPELWMRSVEEVRTSNHTDRDRAWYSLLSEPEIRDLGTRGDKNEAKERVDVLYELMEQFPPLVYKSDLPKLPNFRRKNLKALVETDTARFVKIVCATIPPPALIPPRANTVKSGNGSTLTSIGSVLSLQFWRTQNPAVDHVDLLKPLFAKLSLGSGLKGERIFSGEFQASAITNYSVISPVLLWMIDEAMKLLDSKLPRTGSALEALDRMSAEQLTRLRKFILDIMTDLAGRLCATSVIESKAIPQGRFEEQLRGLILRLITMEVAVVASEPLSFKALATTLNEVVTPVVNLARQYPALASQAYTAFRPVFLHLSTLDWRRLDFFAAKLSEELRAPARLFIETLKPASQKTVFDYPALSLSPAYDNTRPWSNEDVLSELLKLYPFEHNAFMWLEQATNFLSASQKAAIAMRYEGDLKFFEGMFDSTSKIPYLWMALDLVPDPDARHEIATKLRERVGRMKLQTWPEVTILDGLQMRQRIRVPAIREELEKAMATKPSIEERVTHMRKLISVTLLAKSVAETTKTLKFIFNRSRNEMRLNMDMLFYAIDSMRDRTFLEDATWDEGKELAAMYAALDVNNMNAVSESPAVATFLNRLAENARAHFISDPRHPLFEFALELEWRRSIYRLGVERGSGGMTIAGFGTPTFSRNDGERAVSLETARRAVAVPATTLAESYGLWKPKQTDREVTQGHVWTWWGCFLIKDGDEDRFADAIVAFYKTRFEGIAENEGKDFFSTVLGDSVMRTIRSALGLRWVRSKAVMAHVDRSLGLLEAAPLLPGLPDGDTPVLDWVTYEPGKQEAINFVETVYGLYGDTCPHPFWSRFADLRLRSTFSTSELAKRYAKQSKAGQDEFVYLLFRMSPSGSALHDQDIMTHVLMHLPHLLRPQHISENRAFIGTFNPTNTDARLVFQLHSASALKPLPADMLLPWQAELLTARYAEEALNPKVPLRERVTAASRMMVMTSTSVHDIAAFLTTPSLPPRIIEAVLMFLPKIDEPSAALSLLIAPVFLKSDLARTAIHAVKNAMADLAPAKRAELFRLLVPAEGKPMFKVSVMKELVRLLVSNVSEVPGLKDVILELWGRAGLHRDVRIALLQAVVLRLDDGNEIVKELCWTIAKDAISDKWILRTHRADVYVRKARETSYRFGELSTAIIDSGIAKRYLSELLIPMHKSLIRIELVSKAEDAFLLRFEDAADALAAVESSFGGLRYSEWRKLISDTKTTFRRSEECLELNKMLPYTWTLIRNWTYYDTVPAITALMGPYLLEWAKSEETSTTSADATLDCLWMCTVKFLDYAVTNHVDVISMPDSWKFIEEAVKILAGRLSTALREADAEAFNVVEAKLLSLSLDSFWIIGDWCDIPVGQASRMQLVEPLRSGDPLLQAIWWRTVLDRRVACVRIRKAAATADKAVAAQRDLEVTAEIIDLMRECIDKSLSWEAGRIDNGMNEAEMKTKLDSLMAEVPVKNELLQLAKDDDWCADVSGFRAWRIVFRHQVLTFLLRTPALVTPEIIEGFVNEVLAGERYYLEEKHAEVSALLVAGMKMTQAEHDANTRAKSRQIMTRLVTTIAAKAQESKYEIITSRTEAMVFTSVLESNSPFVLEAVPDIVCDYVSLTKNSVGIIAGYALERFGGAGWTLVSEAMIDGWVHKLNLPAMDGLEDRRTFDLFEIVFEKKKGVYVQTAESRARRSAMATVESVQQHYHDLWNRGVDLMKGKMKFGGKGSGRLATAGLAGIKGARLAPNVGEADVKDRTFTPTAAIGQCDTKLLLTNPYLLFRFIDAFSGGETRVSKATGGLFPTSAIPETLSFKNVCDGLITMIKGPKEGPHFWRCEFAAPLKMMLHLASMLSRDAAADFAERGLHADAVHVKKMALQILETIHEITGRSTIALNPGAANRDRTDYHNILDTLLTEASEDVPDGGKQIGGFWELVDELFASRDWDIMRRVIALRAKSWKLRWQA